MRMIAFLTEPASVRVILMRLGESTVPPPLAHRARAPPSRPRLQSARTAGSERCVTRTRILLRSDRALNDPAISPLGREPDPGADRVGHHHSGQINNRCPPTESCGF